MAFSTPNADSASAETLLEGIVRAYSPPEEIIADNGPAFASKEFKDRAASYGIVVRPTKPYRPMANGKVERFNRIIKQIFKAVSAHPDYATRSFPTVLSRTLEIYNHRPSHTGYAPVYLALGREPDIQARVHATHEVYVREPTEQEEMACVKDLVRSSIVQRQQARQAVASGKATRDQLRAYLAEKKARTRVYGKGDWVLKQRQRQHKAEPYYDGPYCIAATHRDGAYTLRTPGGIALRNRYHGQQLFPAYAIDGHPVRSLWYANKRLLEQDRARLARLEAPWRATDAAAEGEEVMRD